MKIKPQIAPRLNVAGAEFSRRGERVMLRSVEVSDAPSVRAIFRDSTAMAMLPCIAKARAKWSLEQATRWCIDNHEKAEQGERSIFAILEAETSQFVGVGGLNSIDQAASRGDFGLLLHPHVWGTSVASEVHLLGLEYAFDRLTLGCVTFTTTPGNARMRGFFDRVGIAFERISDEPREDGVPYFLYALYVEDWSGVKNVLLERIQRKLLAE